MAQREDLWFEVWEKDLVNAEVEYLGKAIYQLIRLAVPGGWLVVPLRSDVGLTFVPDPEHAWDPRKSYDNEYQGSPEQRVQEA